MWLVFFKKYWKALAALIVALACFGGGAYLGRRSVKPHIEIQVQEKIVEKEKIVTVEIEKERVKTDSTTTIVTKPDGSATTTIVEHTETISESSTKIQKESKKTAERVPAAEYDKYRLGLSIGRPVLEPLAGPLHESHWSVTVGARAFGPVWVDAAYDFSNKEVSVGLSVQF